jgi:hypothetical protein|tara:strand:+ start:238 stop:357 length:120 start_codon:yes stop_codon:yes gene_type:complete
MYGLADRLNKTIAEIECLPYNELAGWLAYLEIIDGAGKS